MEEAAAGSDLIYSSLNTQLKIDGKVLGVGKLFINTLSLDYVWPENNKTLSIKWKDIMAHGISAGAERSIYVSVQEELNLPEDIAKEVPKSTNEESSVDSSEDSSDENEPTELYFTPDDPNDVDFIYRAMKECQLFNSEIPESSTDDSMEIDADGDDHSDGNYHGGETFQKTPYKSNRNHFEDP